MRLTPVSLSSATPLVPTVGGIVHYGALQHAGLINQSTMGIAFESATLVLPCSKNIVSMHFAESSELNTLPRHHSIGTVVPQFRNSLTPHRDPIKAAFFREKADSITLD